MSKDLVPVESIQTMAQAVAASKLFGIQTADQAMALMLIAQAEGMHPAIAARDYHVIQGRPALKADAMLARFQAAGGKVEWKTYTDEAVAAKISHPQGGTIEVDWTMERAKAAGLTGKDNWKKFPRQMLRARVISEGIRTVFPGVAVGVYTPEEVADFDQPAQPMKTVEAEVIPPKTNGNGAHKKAEPKDALKTFVDGAHEALDAITDQSAYDAWAQKNQKALAKLATVAPEEHERLMTKMVGLQNSFMAEAAE